MPIISIGDTIVQAIDADFEKGLLLIKQQASALASTDMHSKEQVLIKLVSIITTPCANQ